MKGIYFVVLHHRITPCDLVKIQVTGWYKQTYVCVAMLNFKQLTRNYSYIIVKVNGPFVQTFCIEKD